MEKMSYASNSITSPGQRGQSWPLFLHKKALNWDSQANSIPWGLNIDQQPIALSK